MSMNKISWPEFKVICNAKNLNIQMEHRDIAYVLRAFDGPVEYRSWVDKQDPKGADQVEFETSYLASVNRPVKGSSAFASKTIGPKKLFRRKHGYVFTLDDEGVGSLIITVPYLSCKINEVEVVGCKSLDKMNLEILDKAESPIFGIPNLILNQFGFDVRTPDSFYKDKSEYDADLFQNMQIKIEYESATPSRDIGINIVFHEVK